MSGSYPFLQFTEKSSAAKRCLLRDGARVLAFSNGQGNIERAAFEGTQILRMYVAPKVSNKEMNPRIISSAELITIFSYFLGKIKSIFGTIIAIFTYQL